MKLKYVILFLLLTSFYSGLNAQNIEYGVMLDTTHMLIGDQQHLTFKVISDRYVFIQRRQWHPTPVLLPGKSHGRRSLVGCSPWGR